MANDRPSRSELTAQKMRLVRGLINKQISHGQIKRLFASHFNCSPRAAERFITAVYAEIRKQTDRPHEEHVADSYAYWQMRASVSDDDPTLTKAEKAAIRRERDRARENLDRLLGVYAPTKIAATNTAGDNLPPEPPGRLTIRDLDAALDKFAADMGLGADQGAD